MALTEGILYLGVALILACLSVALGLRLLACFRLAESVSVVEEVLYAAGVSFAVLGVATFMLGTLGWLGHRKALILLGIAALAAGRGWRRLYELKSFLPDFERKIRRSRAGSALTLAIAGCGVLDSLLAMAPLTGSDALVYHFTVPLLGLEKGYGPAFWLKNWFWVGQGHALIDLGLALGSDRISMGLILVGGLFTAGALFVLTRDLTTERWAGLAVLVFLLTPMVYWQMGTSGSPDIWMAFYATLAVMAASNGARRKENRWLVLAGVFAGAAAGVKLTGWAIPAGLVTYCLFATRSLVRTCICGLWSLPAGILPIVRNFWWTGDPFFPFLSRWLRPEHLNHITLAAIQMETHPDGYDPSIRGLLTFPFLLSLKGDAYGVGQYFGPMVLALAPLLLFAFRRRVLAGAAGCVSGIVFLSVDLTSQGARFLLPVFPLALALVFAGLSEVFKRGWRVVQVASMGTLLLTLLFGFGSEMLYARDFLPVVIGLEKQEVFLGRMASDYDTSTFVNRSLEGQPGKVMVFFQHVYYLRVPFLIGDPRVSWPMDPDRLTSPQALLQLFQEQNIRWVVKTPDYPEPFVADFQALEDEGKLHSRFSTDVSTYSGFRIAGKKVPIHVVILEVASAP